MLARCCPRHSVAAVVEPDLRGARRKQPARSSCKCEPRVRSSALYRCGMCLFVKSNPPFRLLFLFSLLSLITGSEIAM